TEDGDAGQGERAGRHAGASLSRVHGTSGRRPRRPQTSRVPGRDRFTSGPYKSRMRRLLPVAFVLTLGGFCADAPGQPPKAASAAGPADPIRSSIRATPENLKRYGDFSTALGDARSAMDRAIAFGQA